jgi:pimeloyl-ACP methyl ester carboxylesterase
VSIRFVESDPGDSDALLLSPWPESVFAYEPTWSRLAETTHLGAIDLLGFGRSERKGALMSPRAMGDFIVRACLRTRRVLRRHVDPERYDRAIMRTACL